MYAEISCVCCPVPSTPHLKYVCAINVPCTGGPESLGKECKVSKDIIDDKPDGFGWLALRLWQLGHEGMQHGERLFTVASVRLLRGLDRRKAVYEEQAKGGLYDVKVTKGTLVRLST